MNTHPNGSKKHEAAYTMVEVMVAAVLTAIFFASLFELNAMCLRYIDSSKESLAALQSVQDRLEALRNRSFDNLTDTTCAACVPVPPNNTCVTIPCVRNLMLNPANSAPFAQKATETVTISNYPATANGATQYQRSPNGTVSTISTRADAPTPLQKIDVSVAWTMSVGGRDRSEQTSCIISNGSKK